MSSPDDVRADVADDLRGRAAVRARDQAARRGAHDAAVGRGPGARRVQATTRGSRTRKSQTIVAWVDGGAPKGDDSDMPKMPAFAEGWTIGKPDAVFAMTEDVQYSGDRHGRLPVHPHSGEPAGGPLDHRRRDQAERARPRPSHHRLHQPPATSRHEPAVLGPTNIGGVTPNKPGLVFEPGVAKLLRAQPRHHPADALHDQWHGGHRSHASGRHLRQGAAEEDARRRPGRSACAS